MFKRKLLLLTSLLVIPLLLGSYVSRLPTSGARAARGTIDLRQIQLAEEVAELSGEWELYRGQLVQPGEAGTAATQDYAEVPSSWNRQKSAESGPSGHGYATYRLTFYLRENGNLALKIPRLHTAYRLYINGVQSASAGTVATERSAATPQYLPQLAFFDGKPGENEILIQISNFHHRSGGMLETIKIGSAQQISDLQRRHVANDLLLFGALMMMGPYHLVVFFFRRKEHAPLYFGLFCIMVGLRTLLVGECFFIYLFPNFSWELAHKLMTLTYYWGLTVITMFFASVVPGYCHPQILKITRYMGAAFGLLVILTPARLFSLLNPVYQVCSILLIFYISVMLVRSFLAEEKSDWLILIGALAIILASLNDILFYSIWRNDSGSSVLKTLFTTGNLTSAGQIIFAFLNSVLLAKRFSRAMEREEIMTAELTRVNTHLDDLVLERTEALAASQFALQQSNEELRRLSLEDPLTGICNRRKYDETLCAEWNRSLRHQRLLSLIVVDIDYFKPYNDTYGHIAGDICLTRVAEALAATLSRSTDLVARYGGEEFIVLLPETGKEAAIYVADMLRQKIEALRIPHEASPVGPYVTISAGVATIIPHENLTPETLFYTADQALYQAKNGGRNQVSFFEEQISPMPHSPSI